jgi:hypothetical protein
MSEMRGPLARSTDEALGEELRALSRWIAEPAIAGAPGLPDPARRARLRLEAGGGRRRPAWWPLAVIAPRPLRRSFVLAVIALVVLAALVGAIGFGVPGIRIFFVGPTPSPAGPASSVLPGSASPSPSGSPSPSIPGPPGSDLDLGFLTTPSEAPSLTGFGVLLPTDPSVGPPDTMWYGQGRLTLVWRSRPDLPETEAPGVGLLVTELHGRLNEEFLGKMIPTGTTLTPVTVDGVSGWWISGAVHELLYLDDRGEMVSDSRRSVGDTLIWTRGDLTFRLETALGQDAAIRIAGSIR